MNTSKLILLYLLVYVIGSCSSTRATLTESKNDAVPVSTAKPKVKKIDVAYNDPNIVYEGRVIENGADKAMEIYWSGTSIAMSFKGTSVKGIFSDSKAWDEASNADFNVFVDGEFIKKFRLEDTKRSYELVSGLDNAKHTLEITKRNEWTSARTKFYGFEIEGEETYKVAPKEYLIEFYGDSVTCGLGNEDLTGEDKVSNNYISYAALTARNLNAEYSCICRSGIGLKVSWFDLIMPEMYDSGNPYDSDEKWDFDKKRHPKIVVINILQNDSWIVKVADNAQYKNRFGTVAPTEQDYIDSYVDFVKKIKGHYPDTKIICMLGNMDITKGGSEWPERVKKVVASFDEDVYYVSSPHIDTNGLGHPKEVEHKKSADILTDFIKKNIL